MVTWRGMASGAAEQRSSGESAKRCGRPLVLDSLVRVRLNPRRVALKKLWRAKKIMGEGVEPRVGVPNHF